MGNTPKSEMAKRREAEEAAAAEAADDGLVHIEYKGLDLTLPQIRDWPPRQTADMQRGKMFTAIEDMLGRDQWDELMDVCETALEFETDFGAALAKAFKFKSPGKSSRSSD